MKFIVLSIILLGALHSMAVNCIPEREFVEFPHGGKYHRIHPSGNYILYSDSSGINKSDPEVFIADISTRDASGKRIVKKIPTKMGFEAYPLEPSWEFITTAARSTSNTRDIGLSFYRFSDLIKRDSTNFNDLEPEMKDPSRGDIYHSIVEIKKDGKVTKYLKTNYHDTLMEEYEVSTGANGKKDLKKLPHGQFCKNLTETHADNYNKLRKKKDELENQLRHATSANAGQIKRDLAKVEIEFSDARNVAELATPILSKDGKYIATKYGNPHTIKVYELSGNGNCNLVKDTGYDGSKVSFSYPEQGKLPKIVFTNSNAQTGVGQVLHYDLQSDKVHKLSGNDNTFQYLPGFTADGRVIYAKKDGFVIVDSKRIASDNNTCIEGAVGTPTSPTRKSDQSVKGGK
jgi:hypothetical protein